MSQPENGWLEIIRYIDETMRPELVQYREAIHALQERLDDWEHNQDHKRIEFEQRIDAKLSMIGRDAEDAKVALNGHFGSHKLKDKEHLDRVEALQQERIKARTTVWVQIIILIGVVIVAAINLVPHLLK